MVWLKSYIHLSAGVGRYWQDYTSSPYERVRHISFDRNLFYVMHHKRW